MNKARPAALIFGGILLATLALLWLRPTTQMSSEQSSLDLRAQHQAAPPTSPSKPVHRNGEIVSAQAANASRKQQTDKTDATAPNQPNAWPPSISLVDYRGEMAKAQLDSKRKSQSTTKRPEVPDWMGDRSSIERLVEQARSHGRDWTFGWISLLPSSDPGDLAESFKHAGIEILGPSGRFLRAKLPADQSKLAATNHLAAVHAMGAPPPDVKLRAFDGIDVPDHQVVPIFVTLMENDPIGRWRTEMVDLGVDVGRYDSRLRFYEAKASRRTLEKLAESDFVASLEPVKAIHASHDTAVPAMGASALRMYEDPGLFSGITGASVPIGVMDTGLNLNHPDISSNRSSICGANFVDRYTLVNDDDLWVDQNGHGTHVTGTIAGNGFIHSDRAGIAPGVQHIRFAKVLSRLGSGHDIFILRGMDYLAKPSSCPSVNSTSDRAMPLIVNMSLSAKSLYWEGRTVAERKLDAIVWDSRQLYVVSQSNSRRSGFSNHASAKNSLAVGAAYDDGSIAGFSSYGPTADGRLAPQVVGTGVDVYSAQGDGEFDGYRNLSGTSMSSPSVAGVAALLMDASPFHKEQPALARARLMASAIRPNVWLNDPERFPADNTNGPGALQFQYGLGKVSARTSILHDDDPAGWLGGSAITTTLDDGEYAWVDIDVPEGASRLDLVMTWDEPPADVISNTVLNDLDLWLDFDGDCKVEPCGEHSSTSRIDNVEWLMIQNPSPGSYRVKVVANRVYTEPPKVGLAWTVIRGPATPSLKLEVDQDTVYFDQEREIKLRLTVDGYVAAGVRFHFACREVNGEGCLVTHVASVSAERENGLVQLVNSPYGKEIVIGELGRLNPWEATLTLGVSSDSSAFRLYMKATAWNANGAVASVLGKQSGSSEELVEVSIPPNDLLSSATVIEGGEGTVETDLALALVEPGELTVAGRRHSASTWFSWRAPDTGMVSFALLGGGRWAAIDVLQGTQFTGLKQISSKPTQTQFFANAGEEYLIRASPYYTGAHVPPLDLTWSFKPRPVNDDFMEAVALEGRSGSLAGSNEGATLEAGEFYSRVSGSVWYRWTAPFDGHARFQVSNTFTSSRVVVAFSGERMKDLRLVSGYPDGTATFPVRKGEEYKVVVAVFSSVSGSSFELTWGEGTPGEVGNDDFNAAVEISLESSAQSVGFDKVSTVQPMEHSGSGVRTKWWRWQASESARYAWRLDELLNKPDSENRLMVSLFEGESLEDLHLVATNGERMSVDFDFVAEAGRQYWLSAGMPREDVWRFDWYFQFADATLKWGVVPENDDLADAMILSGTSGMVSGSNAFATNLPGELIREVGRWPVWWVWNAPKSGLATIEIEGSGGPWALTIYRDQVDGSGLELVERQRDEDDRAEVEFNVAEGERYLIAVGVHGGGLGGEFTMRWSVRDPPLRFIGRVADRDPDIHGNPIELRHPYNLVLDHRGDSLFVAADSGLHVFARDPDTGSLTQPYAVESDVDFSDRSYLMWDSKRERLIIDHDPSGDWQTFGYVEGSPELQYTGKVAGHPGGTSGGSLIDRTGSDIYRYSLSSDSLQHFRVDESSGTIRRISDNDDWRSLAREPFQGAEITLSSENHRLYIAVKRSLSLYERDASDGSLDWKRSRSKGSTVFGERFLELTSDNTFLFHGISTEQTFFIALDASGRPVDSLDPDQSFWLEPQKGNKKCDSADARPGQVVIDVVCPNLLATASWDSVTRKFDVVHDSDSVRPSFGIPTALAASPDERFLYVATEDDGIFVFERTPFQAAEVP